MREKHVFVNVVIIWLTGFLTYRMMTSSVYGYHEDTASLHAAVLLGCMACAFLQGFVLEIRALPAVVAAWALAGITFLSCSPDPTYLFQWNRLGCDRGPSFEFAPQTLVCLAPHIHIFFLILLPAVAAISIRHGYSFQVDRNPLRLFWVCAVGLALLLLLITNGFLFSLLPYGLRWWLINHAW